MCFTAGLITPHSHPSPAPTQTSHNHLHPLLTSFSNHLIFISALYIAIPPSIYFLDSCTVVLYILCKYNESHLTWSQIPRLCQLTWPIKPDSDSDSDYDKEIGSVN